MFDFRMGMGAVEDLAVEHSRDLQVVDVDGLPRDLLLGIHLGDSFPDIDKLHNYLQP